MSLFKAYAAINASNSDFLLHKSLFIYSELISSTRPSLTFTLTEMQQPRCNQCFFLCCTHSQIASAANRQFLSPTRQNKKETAITAGLMKCAFALLHCDCSPLSAGRKQPLQTIHLCFLPQINLFWVFSLLWLFSVAEVK